MNNEFEFDMTPETRMLLAQASSTLGWKKCLAELIDNAFDARANSVRIALANKSLVVEDDGIGCSEVDAFFKQGKHRSKHGIGVYGVVLKDAALWLSGTTEVRSFARDGGVQCSINWRRFIEGGSWRMLATRLPAGSVTGTRIAFTNIQRSVFKDAAIDELGYLFYPAIESGRQIVVKRGAARAKPVAAFQFPPLDNVIEHASEIEGREFRVRAGVVQEGHANPHPGFTITYKHRVITNTSDGCGSYGTARFVGVVQLGEQWRLSRNKEELVEDAPLLAETLHLICKDVLIAAAEVPIVRAEREPIAVVADRHPDDTELEDAL